MHKLFIIFGIGMFLHYKNINTFYMRKLIINAISKYKACCFRKNVKAEVNYDEIEPYSMTMLRLWDFGYENILPKSKYELIKNFIEK